ncbi:MAG: polyketide synthase, partial [Gammaproteobacteria bacterium]|nr:polyketide synthase [Gammaproteobacteria bacterium]
GIFIGAQFNDYQALLAQRLDEAIPQAVVGNSHAVLVNRISYLLNFSGPSQAIDTACSSSLVALHQAVRSIQLGESGLAVAGGVALMLSPETFVGTAQLGVLADDGHCKTFDSSANGYVKGEGVATVLLKPLSKAQADGDHIYAVICGTALNHGGKTGSLTAPNPRAQTALLLSAYREAGFTPESIGHIETHGTGTKLGDPIEIQGLKDAFGEMEAGKTAQPWCALGSVKTNIGHLEPAAGIAGVIKSVLAMEHHQIPASLHLKRQNPYIDLQGSPFYFVNQALPWPSPTDSHGNTLPRRCGVSSFGFGGANAHVAMEEAPPSPIPPTPAAKLLFVLSAKDDERLLAYARRIVDYLGSLDHVQASVENAGTPDLRALAGEL